MMAMAEAKMSSLEPPLIQDSYGKLTILLSFNRFYYISHSEKAKYTSDNLNISDIDTK